MDLSNYRNSKKEKERIADLLALIPEHLETALDLGARDGFLSKLIAETVVDVTALDLVQPVIDDERIHCVTGTAELGTNFVASALMDVAGNPFGTYSQEEPCIYCGVDLIPPQNRTMLSRLFSKAGFYAQKIRLPSQPGHANWIHILFST